MTISRLSRDATPRILLSLGLGKCKHFLFREQRLRFWLNTSLFLTDSRGSTTYVSVDTFLEKGTVFQ
jgi:hypothetical protein